MIFEEKCKYLHDTMEDYTKQDIAVAFSGGVDSSLLLKLAVEHGKANQTKVYAVTAVTELHPTGDIEIAKQVAKEAGAIHKILFINELEQAGIQKNPIDRCYRCKKYLFQKMQELANEIGAVMIVEGTNADDLLSYRPGIRAVEELGIKSPLKELGFTKKEIRRLAENYGISVADRPASPCLATRFPYGETLTKEALQNVEKGEQYLKTLGVYNVRLRVHQNIARIEVDDADMGTLLAHKKELTAYLKTLGYSYITLDLEGFRSGSMDIAL